MYGQYAVSIERVNSTYIYMVYTYYRVHKVMDMKWLGLIGEIDGK